MTLETVSRKQFEIYMLLVTTAMPESDISKQVRLSRWTVSEYASRWFDIMGCDSRLALMMQHQYRELHGWN